MRSSRSLASASATRACSTLRRRPPCTLPRASSLACFSSASSSSCVASASRRCGSAVLLLGERVGAIAQFLDQCFARRRERFWPRWISRPATALAGRAFAFVVAGGEFQLRFGTAGFERQILELRRDLGERGLRLAQHGLQVDRLFEARRCRCQTGFRSRPTSASRSLQVGHGPVVGQLGILLDQLGNRLAGLHRLILDDEQPLDDARRECRDADRRGPRLDPAGRLKQRRAFALRGRLRGQHRHHPHVAAAAAAMSRDAHATSDRETRQQHAGNHVAADDVPAAASLRRRFLARGRSPVA